MSIHTPGPWIVDPDHPRDISPADDLRFGVASICNSDNINGSWVFGDQSKANARLIAAAPDLLKALEELLAWNSGSGRPYPGTIAIAAISKAKGERP